MMVQATHFSLGPLDPHQSRNAAVPRAARGLVTPGVLVSIPHVPECGRGSFAAISRMSFLRIASAKVS